MISLPIGLMVGLVLDGSWTSKGVFWWPFFGWGFPGGGLPELQRGPVVLILMEVIGLAALVWCWRAFGLADPENRRLFVHTGHLNREVVR